MGLLAGHWLRPQRMHRRDHGCSLFIGRSWRDLMLVHCRRHSGMLPCLRRGSSSRLVRNIRNPATIF